MRMAVRGTIAITGGASGIGLAVAEAVSAVGWRPALADLDEAALRQTAARLPGCLAQRLDVTEEAEVEAWIAGLPDLSGAVTSAGVGADAHVLQTESAMFRRMLEVNVLGTFLVAKAAARAMRDTGRPGAIVAIASVSGLRGAKGRTAYGASKAAVVNLVQAMAVDLGPDGIRVNAVCPGPVDTPLVARVHTPATRAQWMRQIPLGRYGRPAEIAQAVLFLLDPERASYITGHALAVDGGYAGAGLMPPESWASAAAEAPAE